MKLELKHLTTYLPYELRVNLLRPGFERYNVLLLTFEFRYNAIAGHYIRFQDITYELSEIQPILSPLSAYRIIHDKPMSDLAGDLANDDEICSFAYQEISLASVSYSSYDLMAQNKVDMFGLIPAGFAVDFNNLNAQRVTKFKNL